MLLTSSVMSGLSYTHTYYYTFPSVSSKHHSLEKIRSRGEYPRRVCTVRYFCGRFTRNGLASSPSQNAPYGEQTRSPLKYPP